MQRDEKVLNYDVSVEDLERRTSKLEESFVPGNCAGWGNYTGHRSMPRGGSIRSTRTILRTIEQCSAY